MSEILYEQFTAEMYRTRVEELENAVRALRIIVETAATCLSHKVYQEDIFLREVGRMLQSAVDCFYDEENRDDK